MAGPVGILKVGRRQTTKEVKVTRREQVSFPSGTVSCAGHLFVPQPQAGTGGRPPVVILAHGFSGTMDRLVP
jgi:predicted alpha/beta-fold hydrolase